MTQNSYHEPLRRHFKISEHVFDLAQLPRSITPAAIDTIDLTSRIRDPDTPARRHLMLEAYLTRSQLTASVRHAQQPKVDEELASELTFRHRLYLDRFISEIRSAVDLRAASESPIEGYAKERVRFARQQQDLLEAAAAIVTASTTFPIYELRITYRRP